MSRPSAPASQPVGTGDQFRIVAPANSPNEVQALAEAGADELYCGLLPSSWSQRYGDWDCLSRRQGNVANLSTLEQLQQVAQLARSAGLRASLTLNARYTADQIPDVLDLARLWEQAGGASVIVSNLGVLIGLQKRASHLIRHLSILANVTNSQSVAFFRQWGISRVILPRELSIREMADVTARQTGIEFEAMALNEKCRFIDGLCGFYHGNMFPHNAASVFPYQRPGSSGAPVVYSHDLCYVGHGCQVAFMNEHSQAVWQPVRNDVDHPACAACDLLNLYRAGVRFLKIGGRGFPTELKLRAVSFLRTASTLALNGASSHEMQDVYRQTFGHACGAAFCYYTGPSQAAE